MFVSKYQVGGSLKSNDPSYIIRTADLELYQALKQGNFCSVFEARQMGKSSLLVRTKQHLEAEGFCCVSLNLSSLSDKNTNRECWYKGLLFQISCELNLIKKINFNFNAWWNQHRNLQPIQRLHYFIRELLTLYFPQTKLIFLMDEVDSLLSLPFSLNDFFSLIRFYYNQRAIAIEYNYLTFAVFGVATPLDFIKDSLQSPFYIGTAIKLSGFKATEVHPLITAFEGKVSHPDLILKEILWWTEGQPFLTQKLCQIIWKISQKTPRNNIIIPEGKEKQWIATIVYYFILKNWRFQDEPEHLQTIQNRLTYDQKQTQKNLKIYHKILHNFDIKGDQSREQTELLLSGLVVKQQGLLKVKNPIYRHVFNLKWVEDQLTRFTTLEHQDLEYQSVFNRSSFSSS
ncbi:AAA-like domain-containing protein [Lyngbya sp. PCC 8106]|uniref:AAA-like domain-containing protein n=1 Tax=Lyngbya sp. (strain PCC 8106) TaxID=313612 RepID=UPI0000EAB033|nr:AAA-like domain-containing protein [Lyngbya sp. PCC 8106]EAW39297.1 WD-40 repeat protein [Lyngbya sp. PCC 8106]